MKLIPIFFFFHKFQTGYYPTCRFSCIKSDTDRNTRPFPLIPTSGAGERLTSLLCLENGIPERHKVDRLWRQIWAWVTNEWLRATVVTVFCFPVRRERTKDLIEQQNGSWGWYSWKCLGTKSGAFLWPSLSGSCDLGQVIQHPGL